MVRQLKADFLKYIADFGYHITDNGIYQENFPWLMLRTNREVHHATTNLDFIEVSLMLDIFSTYTGEKEILDITSQIGENFVDFLDTHPYITYGYQSDLKVLDDKNTGPVRKHGVVKYSFVLISKVQKEATDGD